MLFSGVGSVVSCLPVRDTKRELTNHTSRLLVESASSDKDVVVFREAEPQHKHAIHEVAGLWTHTFAHQVPICACLVQESDLDAGQEHGMDADHAPQTLEASFAMAATTLSYSTTVRSIFLVLANVSPFQYDLTVVLPRSAAAGILHSALRPQNAAVADATEGSPEAV